MRLRVLIAEDDPDLRDLLAHILRAAGHRLEVSIDGADCVERALVFQPHVVVVDLQMPRMDGIEAIRRLRAAPDTADAAIIVITGHAEIAKETCAAGEVLWDDLLTKPAGAVDIADAIDRAIRARSMPVQAMAR